jgi:hypothetical protein
MIAAHTTSIMIEEGIGLAATIVPNLKYESGIVISVGHLASDAKAKASAS